MKSISYYHPKLHVIITIKDNELPDGIDNATGIQLRTSMVKELALTNIDSSTLPSPAGAKAIASNPANSTSRGWMSTEHPDAIHEMQTNYIKQVVNNQIPCCLLEEVEHTVLYKRVENIRKDLGMYLDVIVTNGVTTHELSVTADRITDSVNVHLKALELGQVSEELRMGSSVVVDGWSIEVLTRPLADHTLTERHILLNSAAKVFMMHNYVEEYCGSQPVVEEVAAPELDLPEENECEAEGDKITKVILACASFLAGVVIGYIGGIS